MKKGKRRLHRGRDKAQHGPVHGPVRDAEARDWLPIVRRTEWVCGVALTATAAFLTVYRATKSGALWRDEATTLASASLPSFSEMWHSMVYSRPPVLPYLIIRGWTGLGWFGGVDTSWVLLTCLTSFGILVALWSTIRLVGVRVPLLALALFALNPSVVQWGGSPRGYGLGALLIVAAFGLIWKVVETPTPLWLTLATLFVIASVQSVLHNVPLVFAICVAGALVCVRKRMPKRAMTILSIGAISALSLLPYLPMIKTYQATNVLLAVSIGFWGTLDRVGIGLGSGNHYLLWAWGICGAVALFAIGYAITVRAKVRSAEGAFDLAQFSLTALIIGSVGYLLLLMYASLTVYSWHCVPIIGLIAISIDVLMDLAATTAARRTIRLVLALALAGAALPDAWKQASMRLSNVDVIARSLQQQASPNDLIVVNPWFVGSTFEHYYRGKTPWMTVPQMATPGLFRLDLMKEAMQKEDPLRPIFEAMEKALRSGNRVWWVGDLSAPEQGQSAPSLAPAPHSPAGWHMTDYQMAWTMQLGNFAMQHVTEAGPIDLHLSQPVSPFEDMIFQYFKGWQP